MVSLGDDWGQLFGDRAICAGAWFLLENHGSFVLRPVNVTGFTNNYHFFFQNFLLLDCPFHSRLWREIGLLSFSNVVRFFWGFFEEKCSKWVFFTAFWLHFAQWVIGSEVLWNAFDWTSSFCNENSHENWNRDSFGVAHELNKYDLRWFIFYFFDGKNQHSN